MTRKRVTASEKKQRHEWAVRQIDAGMGLSELTALTAETCGCSRRQARDVVAAVFFLCLAVCSWVAPQEKVGKIKAVLEA